MTATPVNGYCTLTEMKSGFVLNTDGTTYSTSTASDDFICDVITAVSRGIDRETSRYFYESTADEVRYFTPVERQRLFVGDFVSITSIYTDTLAGDRTYPYLWATTDYDLWPFNATSLSEPEPYRFVDRSPAGNNEFPVGIAKSVKITGKFGWPEVPQIITNACILWSARLYMRYAAPLGVSSVSALGQQMVRVPPPDPDVAAMLNNYKAPAV